MSFSFLSHSRRTLGGKADFEKVQSRDASLRTALDIASKADAGISKTRKGARKRAWRSANPHSEGR